MKTYAQRQKEREQEQKQEEEERRKALLPPEIDLRSICSDSDRCRTIIKIFPDWDVQGVWLQLGAVSILTRGDRSPGEHFLEASFKDGVTDFEHDLIKAIRIPIVGLQLDNLPVHYHQVRLIGWVDSQKQEDFRVPSAGYDPSKMEGAHRCKDKDCLRADPKGHIIAPEGFYVPPKNEALFEKVRGKKIEIIIGAP